MVTEQMFGQFTKNQVTLVYEALKARHIHPEGSFDKQRRWYPTDKEDCGVSATLRSPSRAYPFSYMVGCRTLKHVKAVAEHSPELFIRKLVAIKEPITPVGSDGTVSRQ